MSKKTIRKFMHKAISILACVLFLSTVSACNTTSKTLKIGTGGEKGTYYSYMTSFANLAKDDFTITPLTTAGSAASVRLLQKGFVDGAIVQDDILESAIKGEGVFANENTKNNLTFSAVASLYTESLQIIVRADSDIQSVKDLKGKRVSVGEEESGVIVEAEQVLAIYGLTFRDLETYNNNFEDSASALNSGNLDAFFCVAGAPTNAVAELAKDCSIRLLSIDDAEIEKLINLYPYYESVTLPAETYNGLSGDVNTIGVRAILVVSNSCKEDTVYKLLRAVTKHSGTLNENIVTDGETSLSKAAENVSIPFHPGAAKYYSENGITVAASSGSKTTFVQSTQDN